MSRFISGGTTDEPTERDEAWLKAQQGIEARHREKVEAGRQEGGKSLFETLQANKAAKQEAFEESSRLKNQFRSLDEDEVEFLESVLESSKAKEAEVKKETIEQLDAFRRQQDGAGEAIGHSDIGEAPELIERWESVPRKRKRQKDILGGVKIRRRSSADNAASRPKPTTGEKSEVVAESTQIDSNEETKTDQKEKARPVPGGISASSTSPKPSLGLANYSSDEDE